MKKKIIYVKFKPTKKPYDGDKKWNKEAGSTMARLPKEGENRPYVPVVPEGLSALEYRNLKMEEAKLERERLNALLKENAERVRLERKNQPLT